MKLWTLLLGTVSLLAGCGLTYVSPMLVGTFEGNLTSQSTSEVFKLRLASAITQKTDTFYSFKGSAQFLGRTFQLEGTEQASGLLRYQTPPTQGNLHAFLTEGNNQTYCLSASNYSLRNQTEVYISVYQMTEPSTQFCHGTPFASGVLNKAP